MPAHQATCVAIGDRALMIEGEAGIGKSSLALALIDRGAHLLGDDGVWLEPKDGRLLVRPHEATRGLMEVRNLGLIAFPARDEAVAALVIVLDAAAPRFVESAETTEREGITLPLLRLWPHDTALPLKAELALRRYGLSLG